jgi:hypothetical protein
MSVSVSELVKNLANVSLSSSKYFRTMNWIFRRSLILRITLQCVSLEMGLSAQIQPIAESRTGENIATSMTISSGEKFALISTG